MSWIKKNKFEFFIIFGIILLSLFLRFYKLDQYMTFLGDEGRDAIVIKDILVNHHFPLLGPPTSVGGMYLGPLYYYMMAISMTVFWLNPVASAGMVSIIGTLTVGLIYYFSRQWFGRKAAIIASVLYSLSPVNIIYSKSSWNPNPAPFFTLLAFLGLYKSRKHKNFYWFILSGISLAFAIQMHYLALILIPVFILLWIYELRTYLKNQRIYRHFVSGTVGASVSFLFLMSPLLIFDLRHNFMNYKAITAFFFKNTGQNVGFNLFNNLVRTWQIYQDSLIGRYIAQSNLLLSTILDLLILLPLGWGLYLKFSENKNLKWKYQAIYIWLVLGCFGLSFYHQEIYDHYLGFLNPAPYLLLGASFLMLDFLKNKIVKNILQSSFILLILIIIFINLYNSPLLKPPNRQLQRTQEIARYVIQLSQNKPFNFALIAEHNYDAAYQFYLDQYGHKPDKLPYDKTDQLIIVCEDPVCKPIGHPKYEIAAFGWTKIESENNLEGVRIYKLIPNPEQPK